MNATRAEAQLRILPGANIRRLMAQLDMTLQDVVAATGLDERTLRSMLRGSTQPHARTLHKLAQGLGVATDELFQNPFDMGQASFDRATNPLVAEVVEKHANLFENWQSSDFEELYSRMGVGGELTEEGTIASAIAMNARRELQYQVAVIMETNEADLLQEFVGMLFRRVTDVE